MPIGFAAFEGPDVNRYWDLFAELERMRETPSRHLSHSPPPDALVPAPSSWRGQRRRIDAQRVEWAIADTDAGD